MKSVLKEVTTTNASTDTKAAADPLANLEDLVLPQNFTASVGVKRLLTTVPVKKPDKQDFIRVHPGESYRRDMGLIELRSDRDWYIVQGPLVQHLQDECVLVTLHTANNRQGVVFLWPVRLPAPDGKDMDWHRSQREAAAMAMEHWIRIKANTDLGAYEMFRPTNPPPDPEWPKESLLDLIRIAFRDRVVDSLDHPVVQRLRGSA
jgi:hypothetical protein